MENEEYVIELENITKEFPGIVANDNISLKVKKGEIHALLGENGPGQAPSRHFPPPREGPSERLHSPCRRRPSFPTSGARRASA